MAACTIGALIAHLVVYDEALGRREEDEEERVLYHFPEDAPLADQLRNVGVSMGLRGFAGSFSERPCRAVRTEKLLYLFNQCEGTICMSMALRLAGAGEGGVPDSAVLILHQAYTLFTLFNGRCGDVVAGAGGNVAALRGRLGTFLSHFVGLARTAAFTLLDAFDAVPHVPVERGEYLAAQSAFNWAQAAVPGVRGGAVLLDEAVAWSDLPADDLHALHLYASWCLRWPPAGSAPRSMQAPLGTLAPSDHRLLVSLRGRDGAGREELHGRTTALLVVEGRASDAEVVALGEGMAAQLGPLNAALARACPVPYALPASAPGAAPPPASPWSAATARGRAGGGSRFVFVDHERRVLVTSLPRGPRHSPAEAPAAPAAPAELARVADELLRDVRGRGGAVEEACVKTRGGAWALARRSGARELLVLFDAKNADIADLSHAAARLAAALLPVPLPPAPAREPLTC
eukprot:tig00021352_g20681.t1